MLWKWKGVLVNLMSKLLANYYNLKKLEKIVWPSALKTWGINLHLKKEFTQTLNNINNFQIISSPNVKWRIFSFSQAPKTLQKKYLISLQNNHWTNIATLTIIKNHWLVDIEINGKGSFSWCYQQANQLGIYFYIHGQGEIVFTENQDRSVAQSVLVEIGEKVKLIYSLNKKQIQGYSWLSYNARVWTKSICVWEVGVLNKAWLVGSFITQQLGREAKGDHLFAGRFSGQSKTYLNFINQHINSNTTGDMLIKILAEDKSQTIAEGLIDIGCKSANSNSYLKEDALVLSSQARVSVLPNLEILNRDVKVSHGATVGRIDEQILYYLMSRGLTKLVAQKLIVSGFFYSFGSKITASSRRDKILSLLLNKK